MFKSKKEEKKIPSSQPSPGKKMEDKNAPRGSNKSERRSSLVDSEADSDDEVLYTSNVKVRVIRSHRAKDARELTLNKGQRLKQTKPPDKDGMAYGYMNKHVVQRKYGYYPAQCVVIVHKHSWDGL